MRTTTFITAMLLSALATDAVLAQASPETKTKGTDPATSTSKTRDIYPDGLFKWTTSDSIAMRYFSGRVGVWGDVEKIFPAVQASPDGRYFYVLSTRGELSCECAVQTLEVFDSKQVRRWLAVSKPDVSEFLAPLRTLEIRRRRGGMGAPMREVRWNETSTSIEFIGADSADTDQVFCLDLSSGKLQALTDDSFRKDVIALTEDVTLYRRWTPLPASNSTPKVIVPAPRNTAGKIEYLRGGAPDARLDWVASYRGGQPWVLPVGSPVFLLTWFAPNSPRAVIALTDIAGTPQEFMLVDFDGQKVEWLSKVSAPKRSTSSSSTSSAPISTQVFWTSDGKQAILVNTAWPTAEVLAAGRRAKVSHVATRDSGRGRGSVLESVRTELAPETGLSPSETSDTGYVAVFDVESGDWQVFEALKQSGDFARNIRAVGWLKADKEFLIAHEADGQPTEGTVFRREGNRWVGRTVPASVGLPVTKKGKLPGELTITVRQSANDPPLLMAAEGGRERALSRPDPALDGIWIARQEPFTWRMLDGKSVTGGLSMPRSVQKGTPLPLVVQADQYSPDYFLPDGSVPTGFARQALVAQGMAVLVMSTRDLPGRSSAREGPDFVTRLEAAVDALSSQGMIDPTRIGIIGHSRTGYLTHYAITHPGRVQPVAVEIWDAWTGSYPAYVEEGAFADLTGDYRRVNGGSFWQNKAAWLENEVLFNVDRVQAATLFVESGTPREVASPAGPGFVSLLTVGAYQLNQRPVEFLSIPDGGHVLTRVRERKPAMDVAVDWMRFWLLGEEDASAEKADQYARWRAIRQRNEERKQQERVTRLEGAPSEAPRTSAALIGSVASRREAESERVREEMKANQVADVGSDVNVLNALGYKALYEAGDVKKALMYFGWNLVLFPKYAAQLHDSLAEGYLQAGDRQGAIEHYTKALELNPKLRTTRGAIVARLKDDLGTLPALQQETREEYRKEMARRSPKGPSVPGT